MGMPTNVPILGLSVNVTKEGEPSINLDVPLVPDSGCLELPFARTFRGASMLLTLVSYNICIFICFYLVV